MNIDLSRDHFTERSNLNVFTKDGDHHVQDPEVDGLIPIVPFGPRQGAGYPVHDESGDPIQPYYAIRGGSVYETQITPETNHEFKSRRRQWINRARPDPTDHVRATLNHVVDDPITITSDPRYEEPIPTLPRFETGETARITEDSVLPDDLAGCVVTVKEIDRVFDDVGVVGYIVDGLDESDRRVLEEYRSDCLIMEDELDDHSPVPNPTPG